MENRIIELETKIAFQEHVISELNDVVSQQQKDISTLIFKVEQLQTYVKKLTPANIASQADETPPPHY